MRKNDNEILSHDDNNHEEDDKTQQTQKLYVLHVMIEKTTTTSTTDPKIICSAVHLSKICTKKDRNILLQKENQRKRCQ